MLVVWTRPRREWMCVWWNCVDKAQERGQNDEEEPGTSGEVTGTSFLWRLWKGHSEEQIQLEKSENERVLCMERIKNFILVKRTTKIYFGMNIHMQLHK